MDWLPAYSLQNYASEGQTRPFIPDAYYQSQDLTQLVYWLSECKANLVGLQLQKKYNSIVIFLMNLKLDLGIIKTKLTKS